MTVLEYRLFDIFYIKTMISFRLYNAAVYRNSQQTTTVNPLPWINLVVSGMRWRQFSDGFTERPSGPFIELVGPGRETTFCYTAERENWVIQLLSDDIRPAAERTNCEIRCGGGWARVPSHLALSPARCQALQRCCAALTADSLSPDPLRRLRMRSRVCELLTAFVSQAEVVDADDPCERFRQAIEADETFSRTLTDLGGGLGYSQDHLRRRFVDRFGTTPKRYREQRRMAMAADLIANGDEGLQAIARRLGYQHISHFCSAYRGYFGATPGADLKRLR